jgi:hypothetical protein
LSLLLTDPERADGMMLNLHLARRKRTQLTLDL